MQKKYFQIVFISLALFLILQSASALTANSSSYSVSMFGTGMVTGNLSSENYSATFLSEAKGTTRNADNGNFTANIGFFPNTPYYRTVSITSYSVSPSSAVVGSTIGLSISAVNYQYVWAKITSPNAQEQILSLINGQTVNYLPSPSVIGTYNVTFYANSSVGAIASAVSSFTLTEQVVTPTIVISPGGGGGTTTIIEKCSYIWDCTPWSVCSDGKQTRQCKNVGTCEGEENKPIEETQCSESLFDIALNLKNIELTENRTLKFNIDLIEKIGVDKIDVHIKSSIINNEGYEIFSQMETKAVQGNLSYEKEINDIQLVDGTYTLRIDILYGNLQRAFAEQKFFVKDGKITLMEEPASTIVLTILLLIGILALILLILFVIPRIRKKHLLKILRDKLQHIKELKASGKIGERDYNKKREELLHKIKAILNIKTMSIIIFGISLIMLTRILIIDKATGFAIGELASRSSGLFIFIFLICSLGLLIFMKREKIKNWLENIMKKKEYLPNSVEGLVGRKVYTNNGYYIGKINDVALGENRIENLRVTTDKKYKIKTKGVIIDYHFVKKVGEVIIVDELIYEKLI